MQDTLTASILMAIEHNIMNDSLYKFAGSRGFQMTYGMATGQFTEDELTHYKQTILNAVMRGVLDTLYRLDASDVAATVLCDSISDEEITDAFEDGLQTHLQYRELIGTGVNVENL